jgi:uncharacterized protein (DUF433 family)
VNEIEVIPGVCGGDPVIRGTRIEAAHVWILHRCLQWTVGEICAEYPHVEGYLIAKAIDYIDARPEMIYDFRHRGKRV